MKKALMSALMLLCSLALFAGENHDHIKAEEAEVSPVYFVQVYDILPGKGQEFVHAFKTQWGPALLEWGGVLEIETYIDQVREVYTFVTIITFRSYDDLEAFYADEELMRITAPLDDLVGPHKHYIFMHHPLKKSRSLSMTPADLDKGKEGKKGKDGK